MLSSSPSLCTVFGALSDRTRFDMTRLLLLSQRPMSITELTSHTLITRQAVTKHLHTLHNAGLIMKERRGRECVWRANFKALREAQDEFHRLFPPKRRAKSA